MGVRVQTPSGVGFYSKGPITPSDAQTILDAAAVLQLRRAELAAAVAKGPVPGVEIPGIGSVAYNRWMGLEVHRWRELLSVQRTGKVDHLRISVPNNRLAVGNGLRMISVFDRDGLTEGGRTLLAAEQHGTYLISVGSVQMKIVDRKFVVLQGPVIDDEPTLMAVSEPVCLAAAWTYWHRVMASAYPVAEEPLPDGPHLSPRQRQVMALLAGDANDAAVAATLGVSIRTVRSEVAEVMRILGVRSRFAAGIRFHEITEATR
ncbi:helix-turn-helix transcriptional regulator [Nocardioides sp.]|uniref:helix-turn-helix transcriptional regulator n=1 Tax=Nocardioides sp. TaxID=35761 RepID=UPI001A222560|nr:helix-turn-helix transcriptional regulator [Nocardioides sp.]MBJ7355738.1 helix-turn-helix transcriptional regulator [Nocardioides sp.]